MNSSACRRATLLVSFLLLAIPAAHAETRIVLPSDVLPTHYDISVLPDAAISVSMAPSASISM